MGMVVASFIPAAKTIRVEQRFLDEDGHTAQCRFFFTYTGSAPIPADMVAVAGTCETEVEASIVPLMHSTWTTAGAVATDLTSDTSASGEVGGSTAGTLTGGRLPASTAGVVSRTTGRRYRGGHSRVYLPVGDTTKLLSDNEWTSLFAADFGSFWSDVEAAVASAPWGGAGTTTLVMASFYSGFTNEVYGSPPKYRRVPTPRATAALYPVLTWVGKPVLGTQRRRLTSG